MWPGMMQKWLETTQKLSGKLLTQKELATALGQVLGKEVPVQQVDDAAYADAMKEAGVPEDLFRCLSAFKKTSKKRH